MLDIKHTFASAQELQSSECLERVDMAIARRFSRSGLYDAIKPNAGFGQSAHKLRYQPRNYLHHQPLQHIINKQCHIQEYISNL